MDERRARKTQNRAEWLRKRGQEISQQMRVLHEESERNAAEYGQLTGGIYRVAPLMPGEVDTAPENMNAPVTAGASGNTKS